ncbi:MAG: SDR family NAD(P)-dependent oxidoreductase [Deltaproteobacteria bacterium]|nr:MAG: SDR family NAD(P)-dependent oxidoreductase [Deltaproteobacteria bacterium]
MLEGKIALVTGASSGIGLAVARAVVAGGGKVAMVARTEANLRDAARELGDDRASIHALDVTDLARLEELPARVLARFGALDLLVNNAGLNHRGPALQYTPRQLGDVITTNLTAPVVLARAAAPHIRKGGAIVNVASLAGMVPVPHEAAYSASKAGLRAFSRVLQGELRPRAIHVGIVSPGPVDTSFFGDLAKAPALNFSQPMSTAEEVADAVLRCWRERRVEIALPWFSGKLCTLGYLSPRFMRLLRPALERRGERNKRALMERRAARKS